LIFFYWNPQSSGGSNPEDALANPPRSPAKLSIQRDRLTKLDLPVSGIVKQGLVRTSDAGLFKIVKHSLSFFIAATQ
jgi:hypothetical protein